MTDPLHHALGPKPTGGLIVTFKHDVPPTDQIATLENAAGRGARSVSPHAEGAMSFDSQTPALLLEDVGIAVIDAREDAADLHDTLAQHPHTDQVRPEYRVYAHSALPQPIDHSEKRTWGIAATGAETSPFTGRGIKLCVLDSGIDHEHPDFKSRKIIARGFASGDTSSQDGFGHGTLCAGIAAGHTDVPEIPRYGVAPKVELHVGRVLDDKGGGEERDVLAGLIWAIRTGCEVISLSLGTPVKPGEKYDKHYQRLGRIALRNGGLIVSATGNFSRRDCGVIAPVSSPANAPAVMSVAALDQKLAVAQFSCGGLNKDGGEVDLAAPGVNVFSSMLHPKDYLSYWGTSLACPYVSGVAALWAETDPDLRGKKLWDRVVAHARDVQLPARDAGAGLVQAPQ